MATIYKRIILTGYLATLIVCMSWLPLVASKALTQDTNATATTNPSMPHTGDGKPVDNYEQNRSSPLSGYLGELFKSSSKGLFASVISLAAGFFLGSFNEKQRYKYKNKEINIQALRDLRNQFEITNNTLSKITTIKYKKINTKGPYVFCNMLSKTDLDKIETCILELYSKSNVVKALSLHCSYSKITELENQYKVIASSETEKEMRDAALKINSIIKIESESIDKELMKWS